MESMHQGNYSWVEASSVILARKASLRLWASVSLTDERDGSEVTAMPGTVRFQSSWKGTVRGNK